MRIISGKYRGKRIIAPKKLPVRPTTDMAKEALFNILSNKFNFSDIKVLDLFAGIGSISFEFSSRFCYDVTSVEINSKCLTFLHKISNELNFNMTIFKKDALSFLKKNNNTYDIIFADPPYDYKFYDDLINYGVKVVKKKCWFILEHSKYISFERNKNFKECKKYGSVNFSIFENNE